MAQRSPWNPETALPVIALHKNQAGPLMPVLRALLDQFGFISPDCESLVAKELNLSRAEVHGVASFYHDFRRTAPGRNALKLCRAEACQSMGGERLAAAVEKRLGIGFGETTADDRVTLEPVYCLGLCASAPSAMLNGRLYGRVTEDKLDSILARLDP